MVAPQLSGLPVGIRGQAGPDDPVWRSMNAPLGQDFFVRFAWSRRAARFVQHEIDVLAALAAAPAVPYLPEVVASSTDPLILVTRRVPGSSLFDVAASIDPDDAGQQLARFLAALHGEAVSQRAEAATGAVPAWYPLVTTAALRERLGRWVTGGPQRAGGRGGGRAGEGRA